MAGTHHEGGHGNEVGPGYLYDGVYAPGMYGYYGNINDASPSSLYKKYLSWFTEKYGTSKVPLTFVQWMGWAKSKGVVLNAAGQITSWAKDKKIDTKDDGAPTTDTTLSADASNPVTVVVVNPKNHTIRNIVIAIAVISLIGLVVKYVNKKEAQQ